MLFLLSAIFFFFKIDNFQINISVILSECQAVQIQTRPVDWGAWSGFKLLAKCISRQRHIITSMQKVENKALFYLFFPKCVFYALYFFICNKVYIFTKLYLYTWGDKNKDIKFKYFLFYWVFLHILSQLPTTTNMSQYMRFWNLLHRPTAMAQTYHIGQQRWLRLIT